MRVSWDRRLYAITPAIRFDAKLSIERCLVCSMLPTFLSSPLTVSTSALFLIRILSYRFINEFFMFFLIFVTRWCRQQKGFQKSPGLCIPVGEYLSEQSLGEVLPSPVSIQSGCRTCGCETHCACGCINSRGRTTSSRSAAWYERVPGWSSPHCRT